MVDNLQEKTEEIQEARTEEPIKKEKPKTSSLIDGANTAAERLEKANIKTEELISRMEEVSAEKMLAGRGEAGQIVKEKTQEEKDQEAADKITGQFVP